MTVISPSSRNLLKEPTVRYAPWMIIEATDRNYTILKVFSAVIKTLEKNLAASEEKTREEEPKFRNQPAKKG